MAETRADSPWRLNMGFVVVLVVVLLLAVAGVRANQINCYRAENSRATSLALYRDLHPGRPVPRALAGEQISCKGLFPEDR